MAGVGVFSHVNGDPEPHAQAQQSAEMFAVVRMLRSWAKGRLVVFVQSEYVGGGRQNAQVAETAMISDHGSSVQCFP